jgi:hypothetical protein
MECEVSVHRRPHSFSLQLTGAGKYAYKWQLLGHRGHPIGAADSRNIPLDIKSTPHFHRIYAGRTAIHCLRNEEEGEHESRNCSSWRDWFGAPFVGGYAWKCARGRSGQPGPQADPGRRDWCPIRHGLLVADYSDLAGCVSSLIA